VLSDPAVSHGVVYFDSFDNYAYALDASTGSLLWKYNIGNISGSGPAVANGLVFFTTNGGTTIALNAQTGAKLWSYQTSLPFLPAVVNGMVYIGDNWDGTIYAFGLK